MFWSTPRGASGLLVPISWACGDKHDEFLARRSAEALRPSTVLAHRASPDLILPTCPAPLARPTSVFRSTMAMGIAELDHGFRLPHTRLDTGPLGSDDQAQRPCGRGGRSSPLATKPKWTPIRKALAAMDTAEMIELLHGLFELSELNRTFLAARFDREAAAAMKEKYRARIREEFYPKRGLYGRVRPAVVKKTLEEYRRSTGDTIGTLDLMVTYVEAASQLMAEVGDIPHLVDSLVSALREITARFGELEQKDVADFLDRLTTARDDAGHIGWGYGDFLRDTVEDLAVRFGR